MASSDLEQPPKGSDSLKTLLEVAIVLNFRSSHKI